MGITMSVIETHTADGVEWGISTDGPNPLPEKYVRCRDKAHAESVLAAYERGSLLPYFEAAGAWKPEAE